MIRIVKNWLLTIVALLTFAWLTLAPDPIPGEESLTLFEGADKVVHMLMLWGVTCAVVFDYKRATRPFPRVLTLKNYVVIFVSMAVLGVCDEMLQTAMGIGRSGDVLDFVADMVGVSIALLTAPAIVNFLLRRIQLR